MKEWQINQRLFNRFRSDAVDDLIERIPHVVEDTDVSRIVEYFTTDGINLSFPAKSYAVAIIYAILIEHYFGDSVIDTLDDPHLFVGTDKHFVRYSDDRDTYDQALALLGDITAVSLIQSPIHNVQKTISYFNQEVLLNED